MKIKDISSKDFKTIYSKVVRLCVEVVVITKNGVLLTKRMIEPCKGEWHTPGGTVIKGEKMIDTVKRVAKAELGVKVKVKGMIGVIEYDVFKNYNGHIISSVFLVEIIGTPKIKLDWQANEVAFFKTIPRNTVKGQRKFLNKYLEGKFEKGGWIWER